MIVKPFKAAEIAKYLSETLQESFQSNHFSVDISNIENNKRFGHYNFGWLSLNKKPVLLVELKSGQTFQGSQIASDYRKMKKLYGGLLVVLLPSVDYEQRNTLIRNKVNFVVVGSQIHMPDIFISLREDKLKAIKPTKISPST